MINVDELNSSIIHSFYPCDICWCKKKLLWFFLHWKLFIYNFHV